MGSFRIVRTTRIVITGFRNFKICMVLANFGPDMTFIEEPFPLPIDFRFGTSIDLINTETSRMIAAAMGSHPSDNLEKYNFGLEYWYNDMFALRFGKKFNTDFDWWIRRVSF